MGHKDLLNLNTLKMYEEISKRLPRNSKTLIHIDYPFLLDHSNKNLFTSEYIGGSGPPPKFPYNQGPDALADYLLSNSIRCILYSYKSGANLARFSNQLDKINDYNLSYMKVNILPLKHVLSYQADVMLLSHRKKVLFDDGHNILIDLSEEV